MAGHTSIRTQTVGSRQAVCRHEPPAACEFYPGPVLVADAGGAIVSTNAGAKELFGKDLTGVSVFEVLPAFDRPSLAAGEQDTVVQFEQCLEERTLLFTVQRNHPTGSLVIFGADMTSVHTLESKLRHSEQRYREIVEHSQDLIYSYAPDGTLIYVNAQARRLGYEPAEVIGRNITEFIHPDDLNRVTAELARTLQTGEGFPSEGRILARDGRVFHVETTSRVERAGEQITQITEIARDITERKQAEQALRESERRYHSLFENMLDGYAYCRMEFDDHERPVDFVYLEVNDAFARLTGLHDVVGKRVTEVIPGIREFSPEVFEIYGRVAVTGTPERFEINFLPLLRWLSISVYSPERGFFVAVFDNITERKRAENALQESEARFRGTLDNMLEGCQIIGFDWRYRYVNDAAARHGRRTKEELLGRTMMDVYPGIETTAMFAALRRCMDEYLPQRLENEFQYPDGSHGWFDLTFQPVPEGVFVLSIDITARKQADRKLQQQTQLLNSIIATIPYSVFWKDRDCTYLGCNSRFAREAGRRSPEEIPGKTDYELSWREQAELYRTDDRLVMETGRPKLNYEEPQTRPDGSRIWLETSKVPLRGPDGDPIGVLGIYTDITERKRMGEALRESEERFRQLVENLRQEYFFYRHDPAGVFTYVSPSITDILGYTQEEFTRHYSQYLTDNLINQACRGHTEGSLRGERQPPYEVEIKHRDGSIRWLEVMEAPILDERGAVVGVEGIAKDVTQRKQMEDQLRRRLTLEEAVAAVSRLFTVPRGQEVDLDQVLGQVAQAMEVHRASIERLSSDLTRITRTHEWCRRPEDRLTDQLGELDAAKVPWFLQRLRNGHNLVLSDVEALPPAAETERELLRRFGARATVIVPVSSESGQLAGALGFTDVERPRFWTEEDARALRVVADLIGYYWGRRAVEGEHDQLMELLVDSNDKLEVEIVEREKAQRLLRQTVDQYTALINTVPAAMYIKDTQGRYVVVNETFGRYVGLPVTEVIDRTAHQIPVPLPADEMDKLDHTVMTERRGVTVERQLTGENDARRSLLITKVPLIDESGDVRGIVGMVQDVTDRQREREHLLQSEKLAAIGTLAAGVAHEINNPIGYINSNLNTMNRYVEKLRAYVDTLPAPDPREREKVHEMLADCTDAIGESIEGTNRVRRIVSDLKSFSRVDRAEKEHANLNEGIASTLNVVWNELKYKCTVEKEFGELPDLFCMPDQLNQVWMNILVNAGHAFTGEQGIVRIKTWADEANVYVSIKDNGCGIAEQNLKKIFEPFFTTKDVGKGTGLGLSLSYDIVKRHRGRFDVTSAVGVGTEFVVTLPREGLGES